jgi:uncharacterized protein (TIGR00251 family)
MVPWLVSSGEDVLLRVYVQPRASRNQLAGIQGEELKVRLTSPPVEGAANRAVCDFFAGVLGVARGTVQLAAGASSRHKRLTVRGVAAETVRGIIEAELGD